MKAIVFQKAQSADGFSVAEVAKPSPADDEVLVAVRASGVNILDFYLSRGLPLPFRRKAKRVGRDFAGVIEAVGSSVTRVKPGDEVFGVARGSFAECVTTKAHLVAVKPASVTFEQAASVGVAGLTALQGLRHADVRAGATILINGASGGIGTFMVQIAKALGAAVTAVCSGRNVEMVRAIGADQ